MSTTISSGAKEKINEDLKCQTKQKIASRIGTRLQHIQNAVELDNCEHKQYILDEVFAIFQLVQRGMYEE